MNLIVGGTHGLGKCIAQELQRAGEATFVVGRSFNEAEHGQGMAVDLSDFASVNTLVDYMQDGELKNKFAAFYWVAGYGYVGDFAVQPSPEKMAAVNFGNVLPIAQAVWKTLLRSGKEGRFVVVSSTTGQKARKDEAVYAGTKHAQVGFARSLGLESERLRSKIKIALFMSGGMQTPFWDGAKPAAFDDFLDPTKVAVRIVERTAAQTDYFYEETIERGSL